MHTQGTRLILDPGHTDRCVVNFVKFRGAGHPTSVVSLFLNPKSLEWDSEFHWFESEIAARAGLEKAPTSE